MFANWKSFQPYSLCELVLSYLKVLPSMVGSCPCLQIINSMERTARNKLSGSFGLIVNYEKEI